MIRQPIMNVVASIIRESNNFISGVCSLSFPSINACFHFQSHSAPKEFVAGGGAEVMGEGRSEREERRGGKC